MGKRHCCANFLIATGVALVIVGFAFSFGVSSVVNKALLKAATICSAEDADTDAFLDPYSDCDNCSPFYVSIYMLNATNADDFVSGTTSTLEVQEMGPYVYRRREIKLEVTFSDDNARVTYKKYMYHAYESTLSCEDCSEADEVTTMDVSYLSMISSLGGEFKLLGAIAAGSFGTSLSSAQIASTVTTYGEQMMRFLNGLNSLNPEAMKTTGSNGKLLAFLAAGPPAIAALDLSGFSYNGIFVTRTVSQWALGYPSLLVGLMLGPVYLSVCVPAMNAACESCEGDACLLIQSTCSLCASAAVALANGEYTCGIIEDIYAEAFGDDEAAAFVDVTCGMCETHGICAMPMPGIVETKSNLNYAETAPDPSMLKSTTKRTGCDDLTMVGAYEEFEGVTSNPVWMELDEVRNPTLDELAAFKASANCVSPPDGVYCVNVSGSDGSSLKPGGASISGLAKTPTATSLEVFAGPLKTTFLIESRETVDFSGLTLHRFGKRQVNNDLGVGYPVDGVHSIAFISGFLVFITYPYYVEGDSSLFENVSMTNSDGTLLNEEELYDGDSVKDEYLAAYTSYFDVEPATGKFMRAYSRTMVSYALAASTLDTTVSMSDVVFPNLPVNMLMPAYWMELGGEAKPAIITKFKSVAALAKVFLPVLIVLVLAGVALIVAGILMRRRGNQKVSDGGKLVKI